MERAARIVEDTGKSPELRAVRNREFHKAIWVASHNVSLIDLLERLNLHLSRYPATTLSAPGRWKEAVEEHHELVSLIVERDARMAATLAQRHFATARDIRLQLWEQSIS